MAYTRYDGGTLIGNTLKASGVTHLFCLHGGHIDPILFGCANAGLKIIDTRHEAAAVHMAEGWALSSGKVGVAAVTAGPGIANALTGIANAYLAGTPIVCLAGSSPRRDNDTWTLQDLDQLPLVKPIAKWARTCHTVSRCGQYAARAMVEARTGRTGPAVLEIPLDVLMAPVPKADQKVHSFTWPEPPGGSPKAVESVLELLEDAKKPMALAGSGAFWSNASENLARFAETLGVPVLSVNAGRGVLPDDHPWSCGTINPVGGAIAHLLQADLILCFGSRLGFPVLNGQFFTGKKVVRVDVDAGETIQNRSGTINVTADVGAFCGQLADGGGGKLSKERLAWRDTVKEAARKGHELFFAPGRKEDGPVHPVRLVEEVAKVAGLKGTLVADGGDTAAFGTFGLPAHGPGHLLTTSAYFGCLGVGIPYVIGAKLARPEAPAFLLTGDGAFGFNAMEFDTAVRHKIPFVCIVANNGGWGMSRHGQGLQFGYDQLVASELGERPYHEMVKGLGGHGEFVEKAADLPAALDRALSADKPACLNVRVDPKVYSPATAVMVGAGIL